MSRIDTAYGPMLVLDAGNDLIARFLELYGEWGGLEVEFLADLVADGGAVADIGACLGTFGFGLARLKTLGRLVFVEANPATVAALRVNAERNCAVPSVVVEALLSPADYSATGWQPAGNVGATSFAVASDRRDGHAVPAPATRLRLEELFRQYGRFDLVKLDVEGMEHAILDDARDLLRDEHPLLWIEANETPQSLDIAELLLSLGYRLNYFAFPAFNSGNFNKNPLNSLPYAFEAGLLAGPGEVALSPALAGKGCLLEPIAGREDLRRALWRTPRGVFASLAAERAETIIALAVRALAGDVFSRFLNPVETGTAESDWSPVAELRDRLERAQTLLAARVEQIRRIDRDLAAALAQARELRRELDESQDELVWIHEAADSVRALLVAEQGLRSETQRRLSAIEMSTTWRATLPLRRVLAALPGVRRGLRSATRLNWRAVRRVMPRRAGG